MKLRVHFKTSFQRNSFSSFLKINFTGNVYKPEEGLVWPVKKLFEKLNTPCFSWEVNWTSWCFISYFWKIYLADVRSPTPIIAHLVYCRFNWAIFLTPFSAFYEYSRNARRVLWKLARETPAPEDWVFRETNMATVRETFDTCVVKLDPKWHYLDFRKSDLISVGSLTHCLTLGFIYGLNILGCGMAFLSFSSCKQIKTSQQFFQSQLFCKQKNNIHVTCCGHCCFLAFHNRSHQTGLVISPGRAHIELSHDLKHKL